jgi:tuftelin-interacting protein 11
VIARLQQVHLVADELSALARTQAASDTEGSLDAFTPLFDRLLAQYTPEYARYNLDEVVVAAVAPTVRPAPARGLPCPRRR